jgi:hypothetical protein
MPGPLQDPNARRRSRNDPRMVRLPADGRQGEPPAWPLNRLSEAESEVWRQLWATPMAVVWDRQVWLRMVARYTRILVACEEPGVRPALLAECRALEDRLGLNAPALARLHWQIEPMEPATVAPIAERPRRRLIVAEDGDED